MGFNGQVCFLWIVAGLILQYFILGYLLDIIIKKVKKK